MLWKKRSLPRAKLCAGGITAKAFPLLDFDYSFAVEQEIRSAYICFRHGQSVDSPHLDKAGYIVDRRAFDSLLAIGAKGRGVEIHDDERVIKLNEENGCIQVSTYNRDYRCHALVGADGVTAGYLGQKSASSLLGVEVHVPKSYPVIGDNYDRLGFYFGDIPNGYGWIFPRKNDAAIGIVINAGLAGFARRYLEKLLIRLKIPGNYASGAKGHVIPLFSPFTCRNYCRNNILLAGDAASFVDPITAEGIYALKSGQEAAHAILESGSDGTAASIYKQAIDRDILRELRAAWKTAKPLYAFPKVSFKLFHSQAEILTKQFDVMLGKASYLDLLREKIRTLKGMLRFSLHSL